MNLRAAILAAIVFVAPTSTIAAEAACFWGLLPVAKQDALIAAYASGGASAQSSLDWGAEAMWPRLPVCLGRVPKSSEAQHLGRYVAGVMSGYGRELGAAYVLSKRGVSGATLEAAWSELGPEKRGVLRSAIDLGALTNSDNPEVARIVLDAAEASGFQLDTGREAELSYYTDYFMGRALREAAEASL